MRTHPNPAEELSSRLGNGHVLCVQSVERVTGKRRGEGGTPTEILTRMELISYMQRRFDSWRWQMVNLLCRPCMDDLSRTGTACAPGPTIDCCLQAGPVTCTQLVDISLYALLNLLRVRCVPH
jgi:hypothetical protein